MTFESEGLLIVVIYIWLPLASYVVFLTTLVGIDVYMYVPWGKILRLSLNQHLRLLLEETITFNNMYYSKVC